MTGTPAVNNVELIYHVLLLLLLAGFAIFDIKHKRVPDLALACFLPFVLLSLPINAAADGLSALPLWLTSTLGMLAGGGTLLAAALASNGGVGGGDIKLTALLGIVYGSFGILLALLFAVPLALIFGLRERHRTGTRRFSLPFVPFLAMGCCVITILKLYQ